MRGRLDRGRQGFGRRRPCCRGSLVHPPPAGRHVLPRDFQLTHADWVVFPETGLTKGGLALYDASVVDWILPHVRHRPLFIVRAPDGLAGETYFQRHPFRRMPDAIRRIPDPSGGPPLLMVDDVEGLLSLVQFNAVELHPWACRVDRPDRPDRLVVDLDPGEDVAWSVTVAAGLHVRQLLESAGLTSFVKTTGGRGLPVVVPIDRRHGWEELRQASTGVAKRLRDEVPERYTLSPALDARRGRIFVDVARNTRGSTIVAPYSTRAVPAASVSVPLGWGELASFVGSSTLGVENVGRRLSTLRADPWEGFDEVRQGLTKAVRRLVGS